MIDSFVLFAPLLLLPIVALLAFVGCDQVFGLTHIDDPIPGPTNLVATPGDGRVVLSWDDFPDATAYTIHRGESSGQYTTQTTPSGTQAAFTDTGVVNGTTYFYVVTADANGDTTEYSEEAMATPMMTALISFVISATLMTIQNLTGWFGMQITVGANPVTVKTLGRMFAANNTQLHIIKIVDATGVDVPNAFATVNMMGGTDGQFVYAAMPAPIVLNPATTYFIVSQETANMDLFYNHNLTLQTTDAAVLDGSIRYVPPYTKDFAGNHSYGPLSFQY
jgi:hypothetical protein